MLYKIIDTIFTHNTLIKLLFFSALREVVSAINRGLAYGNEKYGVKIKSILCSIAGTDDITNIFNLCRTFQDEHVVGIDLAGICTTTKNGKRPIEQVVVVCISK